MSIGMERDPGRLDSIIENHETRLAEARAEFAAINSKLEILSKLPTKDNLVSYFIGSFAIALAVVAIIIGAIIGGLGWLQAKVPAQAAAISNPASVIK